MKCHYEVLNIARDADDTEIKVAYKKLALKWHPDKNLDSQEKAKEQFQLVQQAYEILSDKQERAWYDNHREQILRGSNSEYKDNSLNVFQYFTTTCFKGYNDEENGFYTVYRNVFDQIIKEDMEHMEDKDELLEIPRFGDSTSEFEEVVGPFYAYWMSYSTKKSYVWLDPYDIKETRDRRVLKLIEKENKKVRLKAKKERNEEVRNLVAFVRKRDRRVQANTKKIEIKNQENRKKQEELSKQRRLQRVKELNTSGHQAEWAKFDNVKSELEEIEKQLAHEFGEEDSNSESDSEENLDNLYCVACNKMFKTPRAFQNHELSKKHKENVEILKQTMINEGDVEDISNSESEKEEIMIDSDIHGSEDLDSICASNSESKSKKLKKKKNKKGKNVMRVKAPSESDNSLENQFSQTTVNIENSDTDDDFNSSKKSKKKGKKSQKPKLTSIKTKTNTQFKNGDDLENNIMNETENKIIDKPNIANPRNDETIDITVKVKNCRTGKKLPENEIDEELDTTHICVTCKANFPSKNKLFTHLKSTGHGVYLPQKEKVRNKTKKKDRER